MSRDLNIPPYGRPSFGSAFGNAFGRAFGEQGIKFNPASFGDLRVDLNAANITPGDLSGSLVDSWPDASGQSPVNDAAKTIDARRPTFNATALNGRPSVEFTTAGGGGTEKELSIAHKTSISISTSFAVYFVVQPSELSGFPTFMGKDGNLFRFLLDSQAPNGKPRSIITGGGPTEESKIATTPVLDDVNVIIEYHYELNGTIKFTGNGISLGKETSALAAISLSNEDMFIGQGGGNIQYFNGLFGRMLLFGSLPTTAQRNSIIGGLGKQFGLTVGTVT